MKGWWWQAQGTGHRPGKAALAQLPWGRSSRVPDQDATKRIKALDQLAVGDGSVESGLSKKK